MLVVLLVPLAEVPIAEAPCVSTTLELDCGATALALVKAVPLIAESEVGIGGSALGSPGVQAELGAVGGLDFEAIRAGVDLCGQTGLLKRGVAVERFFQVSHHTVQAAGLARCSGVYIPGQVE